MSEGFQDRLERAYKRASSDGDSERAEALRRIMGVNLRRAMEDARSTGPATDRETVTSDELISDEPTKEKTMSEETTTEEQERSAARSTLSVLARAGVHGTKVAAAAAANKELVDLVEELLGEHYPDLMRTKMGRPFAELVTPLVLLQLTYMFPERFPKVDFVQAGCEYALEAVSRDSLEPLLRMVVPLSTKMAKIGAQYMSDSVRKARQDRAPAIEELEDEGEVEIDRLRERARRLREEDGR